LSLPPKARPFATLFDAPNQALDASLQERKNNCLRDENRCNLGHFATEVEMLEAWVDDLKLGLEVQLGQQIEEQALFSVEWSLR
jgi:hypothetical protein